MYGSHKATPVYGGQMAERLGSRAINQKVAGSIPGRAKNDNLSLGKAVHPTCLGGNDPVLTLSRSGQECLLND